MIFFHKDFQKDIVEQYGASHRDGVADKLFASVKRRVGKGNVFGKEKAGGKCDGEDENEGGDMRTDSHKTEVGNLLMKYKMIKDKIKQNVENGIGTSRGCIIIRFAI